MIYTFCIHNVFIPNIHFFLIYYGLCEIFPVNRSSMIIVWEQMEFFPIYSRDLYITRILGHVKSGSISVHLLLIWQLNFCYSGILSGYMITNSTLTFLQFLMGIVHFFVTSNVERYKAFKRAWELGNTLFCLFSLR